MASHGSSPTRIKVGDFIVDRSDERLIGPHGPVKLGNKAFRVLTSLIDADGKLLTKDALFSSVWDGTIVSESALTSTIKELRRALGDGSRAPAYIESVYGRGYRLIAPVGDAPASVAVSSEFTQHRVMEESRPPVIVVSGFHDEAVREQLPYAGPALREEVLSGLSRFRELQLISDSHFDEHRPSSSLKERAYQLTATLLPDQASAKVITRLRRLQDGRILWVESMSLARDGLVEGVDRIVRKIIGAVLPVVDQDVFQTLNVSENLYDRYVQATYRSYNAGNFSEAKAAAAELETLVRERPDFVLPYGSLLRLYNTDYYFTGFGASNDASRAKALALCNKMLSIDPGFVSAYVALAFCQLYTGNWAQAELNAQRAYERNPFNPARLNEVAAVFTYLGDFDRGEEMLNRGADLQPYVDRYYREDFGRMYLLRGNYHAAAEQFELMTEDMVWSQLYEALNAIQLKTAASGPKFRAWKQRIIDGWHDGSTPDDARILQFIRYHHPFKDGAGDKLFAMAEAALADTSA